MATIWSSNGHPGLRSLRNPIEQLSLSLIEERLASRRIYHRGEDEPGAIPTAGSEDEYTHVVIEVSGIDTLTPRFPKRGFYPVADLHISDAAFLIAPPPGTVRR
jgi:hypothetical protein